MKLTSKIAKILSHFLKKKCDKYLFKNYRKTIKTKDLKNEKFKLLSIPKSTIYNLTSTPGVLPARATAHFVTSKKISVDADIKVDFIKKICYD